MRKPDWKLWLKDQKECKFWLDNYLRKRIIKKVPDESRLHLKGDYKNMLSKMKLFSNGSQTERSDQKRSLGFL